jgi:hypothetical protein
VQIRWCQEFRSPLISSQHAGLHCAENRACGPLMATRYSDIAASKQRLPERPEMPPQAGRRCLPYNRFLCAEAL